MQINEIVTQVDPGLGSIPILLFWKVELKVEGILNVKNRKCKRRITLHLIIGLA